jgi:glucose-1-phosphate thymidylyltransferase
MKGILLAGGRNLRLYPATAVVGKQMLPVFDKPMIYYPLATLMLAGIREILIVSTRQDLPNIQSLFGAGEHLGIHIAYAEQPEPRGIAEALLIGEQFLSGRPSALVLGDNLHIMDRATEILKDAAGLQDGALLFAHQVNNPSQFGVISFSKEDEVTEIIEKPEHPASDWVATGLYFYDGSASERARSLLPSLRGELEISDLNRSYLLDGKIRARKMSRSSTWLDMGTPTRLRDASTLVAQIQLQSGVQIGCVEEVAFRQGFIDEGQLRKIAERMPGSEYRTYIASLCGDSAT